VIELALANLRANKGRLIATVVAIVAGVGFLTAGLMFTDAVRANLGGDVRQAYANVDLAVEPLETSGFGGDGGPGAGVPAVTLTQVGDVDGVAEAIPELSAMLEVLTDDGEESVTGRLYVESDLLNPNVIVSGAAPAASGEGTLDEEIAAELGVSTGDSVTLATATGKLDVEIVGITNVGDHASVEQGGTAQLHESDAFDALTSGVGEYSRVLAAVAEGEDPESVRAAVANVLSAGLRVIDSETFVDEATSTTAQFADILRPVLLGFSLLALFVCGFVIANTFAVVIARRTQELALLRAIGATPRQVKRSVRVEALVIGVVSSILGIGAGILLAMGAQALLNAFDVGLPGSGFKLSFTTAVVGLIAGTFVTVVAVSRAAWRAGRVDPVEAMRAAAIETTTAKGFVFGPIVMAVGAVMLLAAGFGSFPYSGIVLGVGALVFVVGVILSGKLFSRLAARVARPLARIIGVPARLATDNVDRNPKRTAATANALVIGVLLITLVTTAGGTLRDYLVGEINELSSADIIVTSASGLPDGLVDEIAEVDGVAVIAPIKGIPVDIDGEFAFLSAGDPEAMADASGLNVTVGSLDDLGSDGAAVPDFSSGGGGFGVEDTLGMGDEFTVSSLEGVEKTFVIDALLELKLDSLFLDRLISEEAFIELFGDRPPLQAFVRVDGRGAAAVKSDIDELTAGFSNIEVLEGNFIGQLLESVFDFLIAGVNGLLGMSVAIAIIGIINTMSLAIFERRRELGLLRAVGMMASEARQMVRIESILVAMLGTVVGLAAGVFMGFIVTRPIDVEDLGFSFELPRLALVAVIGLVVGLVASLWPARRVTKLDVLEAIRSE
jgi:putative ABC transport system permease protein